MPKVISEQSFSSSTGIGVVELDAKSRDDISRRNVPIILQF